MDDSSANAVTVPRRRSWWPVAKWSLFLILLYFVGRRAISLWNSSPPAELRMDPRWLVPAAVAYLVGWLPSVWFWRSLLRRMGQQPDWYVALRAYFVGHLGKYVPGKALVLVIRGALIQQSGGNPVLAGLTAAYETLVSMAGGAAIALALAPLVIPDSLWGRMPVSIQWLRQQTLLVPLIVAVATVASTPISAWLFSRLGRKALPQGSDAGQAGGITVSDVLQGVLITSMGWICHAFSLGCVLQSISTDAIDFSQFPVWLASVTLATFAGFVVLVAPGGLGVREWVLVEMLKDQPGMGAEKALVAAGMLRIVWFAAELSAAVILYAIRPKAIEA